MTEDAIGLALFQMAKMVRLRAYARYSEFQVGAAIRTVKDDYFTGANVENAAYPCCQCAEASALGNMVAGGGPAEITHVAVVADVPDGVKPCGGCLQRLGEFVTDDTQVYLCNLQGILDRVSFSTLYPNRFKLER